MTVAQGLYKTVAYKKQSALGTPATGSGGTQVRRETATFAKTKGNFTSNEILSNQQYPGDTYGVSETSGTVNGLLSAGNWAPFFASLGRGALSAGVTTTGASLIGDGFFTGVRGWSTVGRPALHQPPAGALNKRQPSSSELIFSNT